jgi:uncharacterized protein (TIGR02996 family)
VNANDMRAAFLATIIAEPAEDVHRLVFADWMEEHGDAGDLARAEFIRVQCELDAFQFARNVRDSDYDARDGVSPEWQRAFDLHDREMRILWQRDVEMERANWAAWCWAEARDDEGEPIRSDDRGHFTVTPHGTPGLKCGNSCGCTVDTSVGTVRQSFRRGFVAEVHCPLAAWLEHGKRIVQSQPIEAVRLTDREPLHDREFGNLYRWFGHGDSSPGDPDIIGMDLWAKLSVYHGYDSPEDAHADLSRACLLWARSRGKGETR